MNYVIIYPDELRAESLSCYGHPTVKTPNIDALAAEGTVFEQNYSVHPVCVASRCALVTGWYPHVRGYRSQANLMHDTEYNFIEHLNRANWVTALAGKDDCFDEASTKRVFTEHLPFPGAQRPVADGKKHYTMIMPPILEDEVEKNIDFCCTRDSIDFIKRHADDEKPFMLWVNFLAPHPPYTCPESYYDMYQEEDIPPLRSNDWIKGKPELYELCKKYREADEEDPKVFIKMNAVYLGMITYVDALVGQIVNALKENGIYEDTTIILCSDHGDFAGDAGLTEKCPNALDDMLTHVPLIIRRPGCPKGHRVHTLTQSIDIFPTIFDFENIEVEYDQFGISLKAQVEGASGDDSRVVYAEGGYDTREPQCFEDMGPEDSIIRKIMCEGTIYYPKIMHEEKSPESICRAVMRKDDRYKIVVRTNGEHEMYDVRNDPKEYINLYHDAAYQQIFQKLCLKTLMWLVHTSDIVPRPDKNAKRWYEEIKE